MRSLRWAWELLGELQQDDAVPDDLKVRAAGLARAFPAPTQFLHALEGAGSGLPVSAAQTIDDARALLETIQYSGTGSLQTRRSIFFTLRHYPLAGSFAFLSQGDPHGPLCSAIAPEDG